jgi:DNA polymerase-3 subunit gamma/tau
MSPDAAGGYEVLARKWRPRRFDELVGQDGIARNLMAALRSGRIAQAFLFTGPRGVGKTTVARILARCLNCEGGPREEPCDACLSCRAILTGTNLDVLEIDAASRTGVDDVRELREQTLYTPASSRFRIYIIDEVHMLSTAAFNALLKTLEEPPPHVKFIFATTDPQKIPATVLSRCQRYDFGRIRAEDIAARLAFILGSENEACSSGAGRAPIDADPDALLLIARKGEGSLRDSLSLLDQAIAAGMTTITVEALEELLGLTPAERYHELFRAVRERDASAALRIVDGVYRHGNDLREFAEGFTAFLRDLLVLATDQELGDLLEAGDREREAARDAARGVPPGDLLRYLQVASAAADAMRRAFLPRVHLESAVIEMAHLDSVVSLSEALRRMDDAGGSGSPARRPAAPAGGDAPPPRGSRAADAPARERPSPAGRGVEGHALSAAGPDLITNQPVGDPDFRQGWEAVVARLLEKKAGLKAALSGSEALGVAEGALQVAVDKTFHRDMMERQEVRRLVDMEAAAVFGRPMPVRCVTRTDAGIPASAGESAPAEQRPDVKRVIDFFGGRVETG